MPLVSVIMPVYNGEQFLAEAIESILTQTFADFEFIIVDDSSTDESAAIIHSYAKRDQRIRLIQHEKNLGMSSARNTGIAAATGEYLAAMDCDDISLPERLEKQVDCLRSHPRIGGVGVGAQRVTEDLAPIETIQLPNSNALIVLAMIAGGPAVIRASLMLRREHLAASGGYRPDIRTANDYELFLRLVWQTAIRYANVPDVLYLYRQHQSSSSRRLEDLRSLVVTESVRRALEVLWGEVPEDTFQRMNKLRPWIKLSVKERRRTRRDMHRLIESMIAANWVDQADRMILQQEINRRLEKTMPRLWQMFLHWRRHRLGF